MCVCVCVCVCVWGGGGGGGLIITNEVLIVITIESGNGALHNWHLAII